MNLNNYKRKIYILLFLFLIDTILNSFTQFISYGNTQSIRDYSLNYSVLGAGLSFLVFCIHIFVQLLMLFIVLSVFMNTYYFKLGMVGRICFKFKYSLIMMGLNPIFFLFEKLIRLLFLNVIRISYNSKTLNDITIWTHPLYRASYFLKYIFAFIYYIFILDAVMELGKEKYYINQIEDDLSVKEKVTNENDSTTSTKV